MPKVLLIDGTSLAYRAFFAFSRNPLRNSKGENTSAAFAFTNSLIKLLRTIKPDYVALVFDAKGPTFRHEKFKEYKAQRPPMPSELSMNLQWIKEIGEGFGIAIYEIPGYEADDILVTLAKKAVEKGLDVVIVTSDKDLLQIVNDRIHVLDTRPKEDILYTPEKVREKFGIPPERIPDLLALMGDQIDNIPGVPGIGEKTAINLINEFGSLENLYQNLHRVKRKNVRENLLSFKDQVFMARELAKLDVDSPVELDLERLKLKEPNRSRLFSIFRRLEFTSLMKEMARRPEGIEIVEDEPEIEDGFAISVRNNDVFVGSQPHKIFKSHAQKLPVLMRRRPRWSFDSKNVYKVLIRSGIKPEIFDFDMKLADYLMEPERPRYDSSYLAMHYLGLAFEQDEPEAPAYEVSLVLQTREQIEKELEDLKLSKLYREIELPLAYVLAKMENRGILLDRKRLKKLDVEIQKQLLKLEQKIYELAGTKFNINSPKQLSHILFDKLKLPPLKKTKSGYSTDAEVLSKLAAIHELPKTILEFRELYKVRSTYVLSLLELQDPVTGRIYPTYNQTGTATGRISCTNPNIQNIPIRGEIGRMVRDAFVAPENYILISADYSQIELRILAHITGDENLKKAFLNGEDIHRQTAALITGKSPEDIDENDRRRAKVVNFGIAYGMSPFGLAKELGISNEEAAGIILNYFLSYPGVKEWIDKTLIEARQRGYVTTIMGRRRYVYNINHPNRQIREFFERIAINAPIQGSAADLIKKAMIDVNKAFEEEGIDAHLIIQVHDELLVEVHREDFERAKEIVREKMENAIKLDVPVVVDIGWGDSWLKAHG